MQFKAVFTPDHDGTLAIERSDGSILVSIDNCSFMILTKDEATLLVNTLTPLLISMETNSKL